MNDNCDILLEAKSARELWNSMKTAFGDGRDNRANDITVSEITYTAAKQVGLGGAEMNLVVRAKATNNKTGATYSPVITFTNVKFEKMDSSTNISVQGTGGMLHIVPFTASDKNTRVRCTCLDHYFRFSRQNKKHDALYGRVPPKYVRKTDTRPSVNPTNAPGICKHVVKVLRTLAQQKLITL